MSINAVENSTVVFVVLYNKYLLIPMSCLPLMTGIYLLFLRRPFGFTRYLYFSTSILSWQPLPAQLRTHLSSYGPPRPLAITITVASNISTMSDAVVVKTRKFKRNPLLSRRQVCNYRNDAPNQHIDYMICCSVRTPASFGKQ